MGKKSPIPRLRLGLGMMSSEGVPFNHMIPLSWYLLFAAALFGIGLFGALSRRNAIAVLMGIELMLNAVSVNLLAFWRYLAPAQMNGQVFAAVLLAVAAAETAVGLALIISIYRLRKTVLPEETDLMRG